MSRNDQNSVLIPTSTSPHCRIEAAQSRSASAPTSLLIPSLRGHPLGIARPSLEPMTVNRRLEAHLIRPPPSKIEELLRREVKYARYSSLWNVILGVTSIIRCSLEQPSSLQSFCTRFPRGCHPRERLPPRNERKYRSRLTWKYRCLNECLCVLIALKDCYKEDQISLPA